MEWNTFYRLIKGPQVHELSYLISKEKLFTLRNASLNNTSRNRDGSNMMRKKFGAPSYRVLHRY